MKRILMILFIFTSIFINKIEVSATNISLNQLTERINTGSYGDHFLEQVDYYGFEEKVATVNAVTYGRTIKLIQQWHLVQIYQIQ